MLRNSSLCSIIHCPKRASTRASSSASSSARNSFLRLAELFKRARTYSCSVFFEQSKSKSTGISGGAVSFMTWTPWASPLPGLDTPTFRQGNGGTF